MHKYKKIDHKDFLFPAVPTINNPLVLTPGSPPTLTCTSTGSPPTTVTFTRDNNTSFTLRDGEEVTANGVTYQLTQTLTDRRQSTYRNALSIDQPLVGIMGSTFNCSVTNTIGASFPSQITIRPGEINMQVALDQVR